MSDSMELTGWQIKCLSDFVGGHHEGVFSVGVRQERHVGEGDDAEHMPEGLYACYSDEPELGSVLLPRTANYNNGQKARRVRAGRIVTAPVRVASGGKTIGIRAYIKDSSDEYYELCLCESADEKHSREVFSEAASVLRRLAAQYDALARNCRTQTEAGE